jgi:t-SNARE complex subunit (syntaxin)
MEIKKKKDRNLKQPRKKNKEKIKNDVTTYKKKDENIEELDDNIKNLNRKKKCNIKFIIIFIVIILIIMIPLIIWLIKKK